MGDQRGDREGGASTSEQLIVFKNDVLLNGIEMELSVRCEREDAFYGGYFCKPCHRGFVTYEMFPTSKGALDDASMRAQRHADQHKNIFRHTNLPVLKYLRIAVTALSLTAFVLLIALWVRSYYACDRMSGRVAGRASIILVSYTGRLSAVAIEGNHLKWNFPRWDSRPNLPTTTFPPPDRQIDWETTDVVWPTRTTKGFGWIYGSLYLNIPNGEKGWDPRGISGRSWGAKCTGGIVPHWFAVMTFASLAAVPWIRWSKRFTLRTLLIGTTLIALVLGAIVLS